MMKPVERVRGDNASALFGTVRLDLKKSVWMCLMIMGSLAAPFYVSWSALFVFLISTYCTLLIGHSVGMHRMMIHRSFKTPKPLARFLIFMGVLVGMGGPSNIIRVHDTRDWAQRLPDCHPFFSHTHNYIKDVMWQLFCRFEFKAPPQLDIEPEVSRDPYIQLFDRTWWMIQILLAGVFFMIGGIGWVLWGCCLRVFVSILGHWSVTYVCHNPGPSKWHVKDAGVQASNLRFGGFITHGECWHNNHHAFPESAQIGLEPHQLDTAWMVIQFLQNRGLAYDVGRPRHINDQEDLIRLEP